MSDEIVVNVEIPDTPTENQISAEPVETVVSGEIVEKLEELEYRRRFDEILAKLEAAQIEMKSEISGLKSEIEILSKRFDDLELAAIVEEEAIDSDEDINEDDAPVLQEVEIIPAEPTEDEKKEEAPTKRSRFFI